jgi:hypothetical protein
LGLAVIAGARSWSRALRRVRAAGIMRTIGLTAASLVLFGLARYAEASTAAGTVIGNQTATECFSG